MVQIFIRLFYDLSLSKAQSSNLMLDISLKNKFFIGLTPGAATKELSDKIFFPLLPKI